MCFYIIECLCLIAIFGYLGYLYNKKYNSKSLSHETDKNNILIKLLEIAGFVLDIIDYWSISCPKWAPELLYNYYSQHKISINLLYLLGGLILSGVFSAKIYAKSKKRNNKTQFNEVELR